VLRYLDAFEDFDPLSDTLEGPLYWETNYIIQHARFLLPAGFTVKELNEGLEILFQLKELPTGSLPEESDYMKELTNYPLEGLNEFPNSSSLDYFLHFADAHNVALPTIPSFGVYQWSWLLAVSALASVSDFIAISTGVFHWDPDALNPDTGAFSYKEKHHLLLEAMESLGFARLYHRIEKGTLPITTLELKRRANIPTKKLEKFHEVKLQVILERRKLPKELSTRKAALTIYERLSSDLTDKFKRIDPERTIESWLKQMKDGKCAGQPPLPPLWE
jgi:hypothetical protein